MAIIFVYPKYIPSERSPGKMNYFKILHKKLLGKLFSNIPNLKKFDLIMQRMFLILFFIFLCIYIHSLLVIILSCNGNATVHVNL